MKRQRERVHGNARETRRDLELASCVHNRSMRVGCFAVSNSFLLFLLAMIFASFSLRTILSLTDFYPNESERNPMIATSPMDGCSKGLCLRGPCQNILRKTLQWSPGSQLRIFEEKKRFGAVDKK